jgi:hypothetical protein
LNYSTYRDYLDNQNAHNNYQLVNNNALKQQYSAPILKGVIKTNKNDLYDSYGLHEQM